jgi:hypothetical protein
MYAEIAIVTTPTSPTTDSTWLGDEAHAQPHGGEDERELADLRDRDAGQERRALRVAESGDDPDEDERVSDQDEERQHESFEPVGSGVGELHLRPERHEEHRDEERHQGMRAPPQVVCEPELRNRQPCQERADLGRQIERVGRDHQPEAPGQAPDEQRAGRGGGPAEDRGQKKTASHERCNQEQPHSAEGAGEANGDAARAHRIREPRPGKEREHHDDDDVLDEEDADRDLPVERVQLVLLVEELHHHGGAAERERRRDEHRLDHLEPQHQTEPESDHRGEGDLPEARRDRYLADLADAARLSSRPTTNISSTMPISPSRSSASGGVVLGPMSPVIGPIRSPAAMYDTSEGNLSHRARAP